METERKTCSICEGNGRTGGHECPICDGQGYIDTIVQEKKVDAFWDKLNPKDNPEF
jgi:DnaJ-class molecular chaperone